MELSHVTVQQESVKMLCLMNSLRPRNYSDRLVEPLSFFSRRRIYLLLFFSFHVTKSSV